MITGTEALRVLSTAADHLAGLRTADKADHSGNYEKQVPAESLKVNDKGLSVSAAAPSMDEVCQIADNEPEDPKGLAWMTSGYAWTHCLARGPAREPRKL